MIDAPKWSPLVLTRLSAEPLRYSELRAMTPEISQRMLTVTLRRLYRDGLVTRTAYAEIPPRVEYGLTALGAGLAQAALPLVTWYAEHRDDVATNRRAFDATSPSTREEAR